MTKTTKEPTFERVRRDPHATEKVYCQISSVYPPGSIVSKAQMRIAAGGLDARTMRDHIRVMERHRLLTRGNLDLYTIHPKDFPDMKYRVRHLSVVRRVRLTDVFKKCGISPAIGIDWMIDRAQLQPQHENALQTWCEKGDT